MFACYLTMLFSLCPLSISSTCPHGYVEFSSLRAYPRNASNLTDSDLDCLPDAVECLPRQSMVSCYASIFHCRPTAMKCHDFFHIRQPRYCNFSSQSHCVVPDSCKMSYVVITPSIFSFERYKWIPMTVVLFILLVLCCVHFVLYTCFENRE